MGYSFQVTPEGLSEPVLEDEPAYCRVLPRAPWEREPELDQGTWLILLHASWSGTDQLAIPVALRLAKQFNGQVQLGIRKFSGHEEMQPWCAGVREQHGSPIWLILRDGRLLQELVGHRADEELLAALQRALSDREA